MNPTAKNVLAVILGLIAGNLLNMGIVQMGATVMPIPGVDPNDFEALKAIMPTLDAKYFTFPFLAHAGGTLTGGLVAAAVAASNNMRQALIVGAIFFALGIAANVMIPAPTWFHITDIVLAYIPMAWLGGRIGVRFAKK